MRCIAHLQDFSVRSSNDEPNIKHTPKMSKQQHTKSLHQHKCGPSCMMIHTNSAVWNKQLANVQSLYLCASHTPPWNVQHRVCWLNILCINTNFYWQMQSTGLCVATALHTSTLLGIDPIFHVIVMVMLLMMCSVTGLSPRLQKKIPRTVICFNKVQLGFVSSSKIVKVCMYMVKGIVNSGKQLNNLYSF